jgi:endonuclease/exonuclease/phosphatase family metal-dependent hydrolase
VKAIIRILFCIALLGVVFRLTFRDTIPITAVVYYALTPMVIAIIFAAAGVFLLASHRRLYACVALFAAAVMALVEGSNQLGFASCTSFGRPQLRVVTWNIGGLRGRPQMKRASVTDVLAGFNADVAVLSEAPTSLTKDANFWHARLPGYSVAPLGDGLVIVSKSSLFDVSLHELGRRAYLVTAEGTFHGRPLEIFLVDFPSNPRALRQPFIQSPQLLRPPPSGTGRVLMGDFNTPRDSTWFVAYDGLYTNAFDQAGQGWRATWPSVAPVLDIDHIWTAGSLLAVCTRVPAIRSSDHRPVVADLAWSS